MYAAKDSGRDRIHIYQPDDRVLTQRQGDMQWITKIIEALEKNHFCLYAQAIASISSKNLLQDHFEILLRMQDENGQIIPPMAFIPVAERYNLMPQIDKWVIRNLFELLQKWRDCGKKINNYFYTVNLSGASLNDEFFFDFLSEQFDRYRVV
jgi:EAL domain-containing protein (putative c-di-GMP-specific phosphodiesterase class I)